MLYWTSVYTLDVLQLNFRTWNVYNLALKGNAPPLEIRIQYEEENFSGSFRESTTVHFAFSNLSPRVENCLTDFSWWLQKWTFNQTQVDVIICLNWPSHGMTDRHLKGVTCLQELEILKNFAISKSFGRKWGATAKYSKSTPQLFTFPFFFFLLSESLFPALGTFSDG